MLALGISAVFTAGLLQVQFDDNATAGIRGAADGLRMVQAAAQQYIGDNGRTLMENLGTGSVEVIPLTGANSLAASGLLPQDFTGAFIQGQSIAFLLRHVAANGNVPEHLDGLVTTYGGSKISDRQLGLAVAHLGIAGGAILSTDVTGAGEAVRGPFGEWTESVSNWGAGDETPASGHLMMTLNVIPSGLSDYLDRYYTGDAEANRMHTTMHAGGNTIEGLAAFNTTGTQLNVNTGMSIVSTTDNPNGASVSPDYGRLEMWNGADFCAGNQHGGDGSGSYCNLSISDDGGFYDRDDGWITMTGSYSGGGMKIAATDAGGVSHPGDNFDNKGTAEVEGSATVGSAASSGSSGSNLIILNGAALTIQDSNGQEGSLAAMLDGTDLLDDEGYWIQAYGSSGFAGIAASIMAASEYVTAGNDSYYIVPNGTSYINTMSAVTAYVKTVLYVGTLLNVGGNLTTANVYGSSDLMAGSTNEVNGTSASWLYALDGVNVGADTSIGANGTSSFGGLMTAQNGYTAGTGLDSSNTALDLDGQLNMMTGTVEVGTNGQFNSIGSTASSVNGNSNASTGNVSVGGSVSIGSLLWGSAASNTGDLWVGAWKFAGPSGGIEGVDYGVAGSSCAAQTGANGVEFGGPGTLLNSEDQNHMLVCLSDNIWHQISWE